MEAEAEVEVEAFTREGPHQPSSSSSAVSPSLLIDVSSAAYMHQKQMGHMTSFFIRPSLVWF